MLTDLLRPDRLKALDIKKGELQANPDFRSGLRSHLMGSLEIEANIHSSEMERTRNDPEICPRIIQNLTRAVSWASRNLGTHLSQSGIMSLAQLIESGNYRYRQEMAMPNGVDLAYPNPVKVPELMEELVQEVNKSHSHPVEKAIYTHLHLCRIHPFSDGNGRLSRLLQNIMLERAGFPPAIVLAGEKSAYLDLHTAAQEAYKDRSPFKPISKPEELFYSFLASKIDLSFDKLKELIARQKRYEIPLFSKNKGRFVTAERNVNHFLRSRNLPASAKYEGGVLRVVGNIDIRTIYPILDGVYDLQFDPIEKKR
jgi:Fic/DOC family